LLKAIAQAPAAASAMMGIAAEVSPVLGLSDFVVVFVVVFDVDLAFVVVVVELPVVVVVTGFVSISKL
jgi:hypothetical protein